MIEKVSVSSVSQRERQETKIRYKTSTKAVILSHLKCYCSVYTNEDWLEIRG